MTGLLHFEQRKGLEEMKPRVIILEGTDFSGKTTVANYLKEKLEEKYPGQVVMYRNPGGTELGEKVRDIARIEAKSLMTQTFAYLTAISSVHEAAEKDLADGKIVILDRWFYSTLAYQIFPLRLLPSKTQGIIMSPLEKVVQKPFNFEGTQLFFFHMPFEVMLARMNAQAKERVETVDRFEMSGHAYQFDVWRNYTYLFDCLTSKDRENGPYFKDLNGDAIGVDASQALEVVKEQVLSKTLEVLESN